MTERFEIAVAVERPFFEPFSYLADVDVSLGVRVQVPFGRQKLSGVVVGSKLYDASVVRPYKLKNISKIVDELAVYSDNLLKLSQFLSDYYIHPRGEVLRAMLPGGSKIKRKKTYELDCELLEKNIAEDESLAYLREVVKIIFKRKKPLTAQTFKKNLKLSCQQFELDEREIEEKLVSSSVVSIGTKTEVSSKAVESARSLEGVTPEPAASSVESSGQVNISRAHSNSLAEVLRHAKHQEKNLTTEQKRVFEIISQTLFDGFSKPILLHGVTGAGKTEIYLQTIRRLIEKDSSNQILVMVPEISLTPQMTMVFEERFPGVVSVVHSNLLDSDRWKQLEKIRTGDAAILIGPRSSVFAPFKKLSYVVVDEEHDSSYKQNSGLMYHGRDVAIFRAKLEGAGVLLGSATPSLESYHNAKSDKYVLAELLERVSGRPLPEVGVVKVQSASQKGVRVEAPGQFDVPNDMSKPERSDDLFQDSLPIASDIIDALRENFEKGFQSIVLVNRRGYAYYLFDLNTREALQCPHCSISLTVHKRSTALHCHYCDYSTSVAKILKEKPQSKFVSVGYGSEKASDLLAKILPDAKIARVDSDVLQKRDRLSEILDDFRHGRLDVLLGTQILAKGHDFSRVTLLCILEVDQLLNLPDLRAGERTFQLMVQAAGRAGRGEFPGRVLIQSSKDIHPVIGAGLRHDYKKFVDFEMSYRKANGYPPFSRMIQIEFSSEDRSLLAGYEKKIERFLDVSLSDEKSPLSHLKVLGPSAPAIETVRKRHRRTVLLVSGQLGYLRQGAHLVLEALGKLKQDLRVKIDVDPQSML